MPSNSSKSKRSDIAVGAETQTSAKEDISKFLDAVSKAPRRPASGRGRVVVGIDATMSRQPAWDAACAVQGEMFAAAGTLGRLEAQVVFFRGMAECKASAWTSDPRALGDKMSRVDCRGGQTQIERIFAHVAKEHAKYRVDALVYIGDAMEEPIDSLCARAGELGLKKIPGFFFHEGPDFQARAAFVEFARLMNGACFDFDSRSPQRLKELLGAIGAWAAGGGLALEDYARKTGGAAKEALKALPSKRGL